MPQKKNILDKAFKLSISANNTKRNRDNLSNILLGYFLVDNDEGLKNSAEILLTKSVESNDTNNIGVAYRYKAFYFKKIKTFDSSFYYYIKAEKLYLKIDDKDNYSNVLLNKAYLQYNIGDYLATQLTLTTALNIYKKSEEKTKLYETLNYLGSVLDELKYYDKAIYYYNLALELIEEKKIDDNNFKKATLYNNLGFTYQNMNEHEEAIENFKKGLKALGFKKVSPELYSRLIDNLAYSNLKINRFENLPNIFLESLRIRDSLKLTTSIILSKIHLSEYYFLKNDTIRSQLFARQAYNESLNSKSTNSILISLQQLSNVDSKKSSIYSKDYIRISDSLQLAERKSRDQFTRIQLETDEVKKENTVLTNQNIATKRNVVIAAIIGLLFVLFRYLKIRERVRDLKLASQQANEEILKLIISQQNQVDEGKEVEKRRISKELHDGVLGKLFGLRLNLDGLNMYDDEDSKKIRSNYINELKNIEQEIREISHELSREHVAIINNFEAILNNLLYEQSKINKAKLNITISEEIDWEIIPNITKINLYRILQEGLQNINKYASAETINVNFELKEEKNLYFSLEDDGIGYDAKNKRINGIGMKNMVQRAQQSKGNIEFKSEIGKGSKIIITFPLEIKV